LIWGIDKVHRTIYPALRSAGPAVCGLQRPTRGCYLKKKLETGSAYRENTNRNRAGSHHKFHYLCRQGYEVELIPRDNLERLCKEHLLT
jgi:hypothetical protein